MTDDQLKFISFHMHNIEYILKTGTIHSEYIENDFKKWITSSSSSYWSIVSAYDRRGMIDAIATYDAHSAIGELLFQKTIDLERSSIRH
jgi:hypothetical protein